MNPLVSVITPCYNGESHIGRFLDSILYQTYPNIEVIIINDGSTDNTSDVIASYQTRFESKGYSLKWEYQENQGQAAALNRALKIFTGEFFTWPDSDDFIEPDAISLRVEFLKQNKKYGFVRSDAAFYHEGSFDKPIRKASQGIVHKQRENLFMALLLEQDAYVCCGTYMARTSALLKVNPNKEIYISRAGQNWQLLLPLSHDFKCGYIDKPLYGIVERPNSHSRSISDEYRSQLKRLSALEDIQMGVIQHMLITQKQKDIYTEIINKKYTNKNFWLMLKANKIEAAIKKLKSSPKKFYHLSILLFFSRYLPPIRVFFIHIKAETLTWRIKRQFLKLSQVFRNVR